MESYVKLPFPPSIWKAYFRKGQQQFKTREYRAFEEECYKVLARGPLRLPSQKEISLDIILVSNRWRNKDRSIKKRDLDNYLKCLIDVITAHIRKKHPDFDDSQVFSLYAAKRGGQEEFSLVSISARDPSDDE